MRWLAHLLARRRIERDLADARTESAPLLALASVVAIVIAAAAAYVPARRAASIDPTLALRSD